MVVAEIRKDTDVKIDATDSPLIESMTRNLHGHRTRLLFTLRMRHCLLQHAMKFGGRWRGSRSCQRTDDSSIKTRTTKNLTQEMRNRCLSVGPGDTHHAKTFSRIPSDRCAEDRTGISRTPVRNTNFKRFTELKPVITFCQYSNRSSIQCLGDKSVTIVIGARDATKQ